MEKEIWFKCPKSGTDVHFEENFGRRPDAEVMCPMYKQRMKLADVGLQES